MAGKARQARRGPSSLCSSRLGAVRHGKAGKSRLGLSVSGLALRGKARHDKAGRARLVRSVCVTSWQGKAGRALHGTSSLGQDWSKRCGARQGRRGEASPVEARRVEAAPVNAWPVETRLGKARQAREAGTARQVETGRGQSLRGPACHGKARQAKRCAAWHSKACRYPARQGRHGVS
jgi:hypothetical protein